MSPNYPSTLAIPQSRRLPTSSNRPKIKTGGDKLLITLKYYREYTTMESIGDDFDCSKSTIYRSITWVEHTLVADGRFQLSGKAALQDGEVKEVAVDVTEPSINRPKKIRKNGIPARKKSTPTSIRYL